jgi:hypothetical protein
MFIAQTRSQDFAKFLKLVMIDPKLFSLFSGQYAANDMSSSTPSFFSAPGDRRDVSVWAHALVTNLEELRAIR